MGVNLISKHYEKDFDMGYGSFMRLRNKIADFVPENSAEGTISFLEQADCGGKLSPKECRELLKDISEMKDNGDIYGYQYCQRTLTDFKELLQNCIEHRCYLFWH